MQSEGARSVSSKTPVVGTGPGVVAPSVKGRAVAARGLVSGASECGGPSTRDRRLSRVGLGGLEARLSYVLEKMPPVVSDLDE